jgi:hypothetical protein
MSSNALYLYSGGTHLEVIRVSSASIVTRLRGGQLVIDSWHGLSVVDAVMNVQVPWGGGIS